jgi:hypothetical protein
VICEEMDVLNLSVVKITTGQTCCHQPGKMLNLDAKLEYEKRYKNDTSCI